tara:strand:- start:13475 stop:14164 length:690 start_codon:yes stop_codon:yes gene_type:complete
MKHELRFTTQAPRTKLETRADGDEEAHSISGYGAVFYREGDASTEYVLYDSPEYKVVERIMPGAFDDVLGDGDDILGLYNHDMNLLLGRTGSGTMKLSVDKTGLKYEIDPGDTSISRDVATHIERGDVDGSSFSFKPTSEKWSTEETVEVREIHNVRMLDVGPVTLPAYKGTTTAVRSEDDCAEAMAAFAKMKEERSKKEDSETEEGKALANEVHARQMRAHLVSKDLT